MNDARLTPSDPNGVAARPQSIVGYTMSVLFVIYALNMLDRQIVNILAEPIKRDLGLSDAQVGMLTGLAFALFYTIMGIPLARIADRRGTNRSRLLAGCLSLWSVMTALCGVAGSFAQMLLFRMGVGVGEAACVPIAHSLVAEMVPHEKRATYMGILSAGIPVGRLLGLVVGGMVAHRYGWRVAFLIVGLPGVAVALLTWFTVLDPRTTRVIDKQPLLSLGSALRQLAPRRTFWLANLGAGFIAFVGYGEAAFSASFLIRTYGLNVSQVGLLLGLTSGAAGMLGSLMGGRFTDVVARRSARAYMLVPAATALLSTIIFPLAIWAPSLWLSVTLLAVTSCLASMWLAPTFTTLQALAPPEGRAITVAIHTLIVNAIGLGFGPLTFGYLSDLFQQGGSIVGFDIAAHDASIGLQLALSTGASVGLVATGFFIAASRSISGDIAASSRQR